MPRSDYKSRLMYSPSGHKMCYVDDKRMNWYLSRGLARKVSDREFQLKFEPGGLGGVLVDKPSYCCCCGSNRGMTKHHVVPKCYRKLFPLRLKSRDSHDVLPLCVSCHQEYEKKAYLFKKALAEEYGAPLEGSPNKKTHPDLYLAQKSIAMLDGIRENGDVETECSLKEAVLSYIEDKGVSFKEFQEMARKSGKGKLIGYRTHADVLVGRLKSEEDIHEFTRRWRCHFVNEMKPGHLPENWSIDFKGGMS